MTCARTTVTALALIASVAIAPGRSNGQQIIYVNQSATGAGDGSSWADAFVHLQDALDASQAGDQIWVAAGTYTPDQGASRLAGDRSESFNLVSGVRLLGGFQGVETRYVDRKTEEFRTFLSGDLLGDDRPDFAFREDNAYHVVRALNVDNSTLIDGFYIAGGNAIWADADSVGGGMLIVDGSPAVMNVVFFSNMARCGGGVHVERGSPEIVNTVFNGNSAFSGGAVCNSDATPSIINATIVDNYADRGAGIFNKGSRPTVLNSILARNAPRSNFLECQRAGYPCTLSEMDPDVITRSTTLSDEVRDRMEADSSRSALQWLRDQPSVVFAEGDESAIRFRLEGGPPTWVLGEAALGGAAPGGKQNALSRTEAQPQSARQLTFRDVVGDDTNGDGKRNNRDKKKALLLSPFRFEFDPWDEGPELKTLFESVEAYTGSVDLFSNAQAGYEKFLIWGDYDVVHVAAHGARLCNNDFCWNTIGTGTQLDGPAITQSVLPGFSVMNIGPEVKNTSPDRWFIALNSDFLRWTYPQGLERTTVMLSACETGDRASQPNSAELPDLAKIAILGSSPQSSLSNSVYMGWDEVVPSDLAFNTSVYMYEQMTSRGLATKSAKDEAKAQGLVSGPNGDGQVTTLRRWSLPGYDLHVRETVSLIGDEGMKLGDGGNITSYVEGATSDGQVDNLWIDVLLEGVEQGAESEFEISFELDGQRLEPPVKLPAVDMMMRVDKYTLAITDIVSAGRDLRPELTYDLEVIIDMPGGGQSRYEASSLELNGCHWILTLGGTHAGVYVGERAQFTEQEGFFTIIFDSIDPSPITQIFLTGSGATGGYTLGINDTGDGSAVVNVSLFGRAPFLYSTGDGGDETDQDGNVVFTRPGPSRLTITDRTETSIKGFAAGDVFGTVDPNPLGPIFEAASWSIEFEAGNALNPDGTPNFDVCPALDPRN